ncbi:hypothetical protein CHUAL_002647 [Chamberlinius hualienensis]
MTTKIVKSNNTRLLQRYTLFVIVSWLFTLGRVRALEVPKANCRSDITDVSSKAFLAPIVFEATVKGVFTHPNSTSQSARSIGSDQSPSSFHQVNLQVDKIYKGDTLLTGRRLNRSNRASPSRSNNYYTIKRNTRTVNNNNNAIDNITVSYWSKPNEFVNCTFNASLFEIGVKYVIFASEINRKTTPLITLSQYTLFSEPVRQNKTSSRQVRKVLCKSCASPPNITSITEFAKPFRENERIIIICKTKGNPMPTITWFKDGQLLKTNSRVKINRKKYQSKVTIRKAVVLDSGSYKCLADSEFNPDAFKETKVVVKPKPGTEDDSYNGTECENNFCLNGGKCWFFSNIGEFSCECSPGFSSTRCEVKIVFPVLGEVKQPGTMYLKSILIVVVILGVLFFVFATYIISRKERCKKRKTKKKSNRSSIDQTETVAAGDTITILPQDGPKHNVTELIPNSNSKVLFHGVNDSSELESIIMDEKLTSTPMSTLQNTRPNEIFAGAHRTRLYGVSSDHSTETIPMTTLTN